MNDYVNAMEELARASLFIRDLADGIEGEVLIETDAYDEISDPTEIKRQYDECIAEIHQGQIDMAMRGWHRAPEFLIDRMFAKNHHYEYAAWFKDDHEKKETKWIIATFVIGFGFRAKFTNKKDRGARWIQGEELRAIAEEYYGYEMEEEE